MKLHYVASRLNISTERTAEKWSDSYSQ